MIDRIAPTRRPQQSVVMRQEWRHLTFLHWSVPAADLQRLLPPGLTVDTYDGNAYIGLVPFTMREVRPVWAPSVRGLSYFHETNIRTYVHHNGTDPGVWFFSLDAANAIAVQIARTIWKLPYYFARMRLAASGDTLLYTSKRLWPAPLPGTSHVRVRPLGRPAPAAVGTLEHFLAERYLLYSFARGRLYRGQVHHEPYPLERAELQALSQTLTTAAGITVPDTMPLAHFASGVTVDVFPLSPCH